MAYIAAVWLAGRLWQACTHASSAAHELPGQRGQPPQATSLLGKNGRMQFTPDASSSASASSRSSSSRSMSAAASSSTCRHTIIQICDSNTTLNAMGTGQLATVSKRGQGQCRSPACSCHRGPSPPRSCPTEWSRRSGAGRRAPPPHLQWWGKQLIACWATTQKCHSERQPIQAMCEEGLPRRACR